MSRRHIVAGVASAGLISALAALTLSILPATAHEGDEAGHGKDAPGEVDAAFPTEPILGNASQNGAPCVDGQADYFPCDNVALASYLPMTAIGGGRGSDVWGWTDPATDRRYVLVRPTGPAAH